LDALKTPQTIAPAAAHAEPEVQLPNTPAGKTFGAFLVAFNSGKLDAMKKFHEERGGNPANAEQDMGFYNQSGGLNVHSVKRSSDTEIEVLAQTKKDKRWVSFALAVEAQAPHGVADIRVQLGAEPGK
ncbi:MAG TPA: hypothetical protein VFZ34_11210, partial [Blastocatellia bacterium]|nr:hypothetical protein [Blastocatellia bacterium]